MMPARPVNAMAALLSLACAILSGTHQASGSQPTPPAPPEQPQGLTTEQTLERLPPLLQLGFRSFQHRLAARVIPQIVVVPDADRYLSAVSAWTLTARFPVLIDDGSPAARERIGRFARAFGPSNIVRWDGPVRDGDSIRTRINNAVVASRQEVGDAFRAPGIVVLSERDPAWAAGVALASAAAQPIVWVAPGEDPNAGMRLRDTDALSRMIETACDASGFAWRELGDDIDAVTLCLNLPARTRIKKDDAGRLFLATTDLIGRHIVEGDTARPARWAWCGQIFGIASESAYSAMCSIFLGTGHAWIVDSYPDEQPWILYDGTLASEQITGRGGSVTLTEWADATPATWRRLSATGLIEQPLGAEHPLTPGIGIEASVILVNSKGMRDEFHLRGRCRPGDVPFLQVPAAVHMVHSWSATRQADRKTVCGRWIERGVFAYIGSVEEPYLSAFQPTPNVAYRMTRGAPWGGVGRLDNAPAGRLTVIGDPLMISYLRQSARVDEPLPLDGAQPVSELQTTMLRDRVYDDAMGVLVMRSMDAEAARLADAIIADAPGALSLNGVRLGLNAAARAGARPALIRLARRLHDTNGFDGPTRDAIWHTLWPTLRTLTDDELDVLAWSVRPDQMARDGSEVVTALRARGQDPEPFIASMRERLPNAKERESFDKAIAR